jgi:hypothetical protein
MSAQWFRWVACAVGALFVLGTALNVIKTLVVPRRVRSKPTAVTRLVHQIFVWTAGRFESYDAKDRLLTFEGPVALLIMLNTWMVSFLIAYALVLWPLINEPFLSALRESGSSLLTLGFAATPLAGATIVYFLAGATGLVVVALLIAYLPTLYASFSRREKLVTMLQSRAGVPAWGPEILWRHQLTGLVDSLGFLYSEWERWAADVAESHTNYPILISFRSPHPLRSWIVGLLAVLDSAALYNSLCPTTAPSEARLCLRMGFNCLRELCDAVGISYDPDPFPDDPIELTYDEFLGGLARMEGFPMERSPEQAWPHFRGWRVNYESLAYALADHVVAPPGPWSGPRRHLPGMALVPQRPADRSPGDPASKEQPKIDSSEWRLRG